jgi:hypothetical protein
MDILGTYKDKPVILQSEPQRRTIFYLNRDTFVDSYFLQFPYIVFCQYPFDTTALDSEYIRVGFSTEPISSLDTKVYLPPLSNMIMADYGAFTFCGCTSHNIKTNIEQFWQKNFVINETFSGEVMLCQMFGLPYSGSHVRIAIRQWEKLDLTSFNEKMINVKDMTVNDAPIMVNVGDFLDMTCMLQKHKLAIKLMF